jgi:hypothetical protein
MTVQPTPGLGWRQRRFISPRLARILAGIMMLIGVTAPIGGIAYAINGATQAQGPVKVRVVVTEPGALQVPVSEAAGPGTRPLHPQGVTEGDLAVSFDLTVPSAAASSFLEVPRELTLRACASGWGRCCCAESCFRSPTGSRSGPATPHALPGSLP